MFGFRADGRLIKTLPDFFKIVPHIMKERNDASNFIEVEIDCQPISDYIKSKRREGIDVGFLSVIIAAYVRAIAAAPRLNRFIVNKRIYARNHISVCFVVLKPDIHEDENEDNETVIKLFFEPSDTILQISEKVNQAIEKNRKTTTQNSTDKLLRILFVIPFIISFLVGLLKFLDKIGVLPRKLIDASPFHTSLFISNMASLRMNPIYHHLYNFGTTSIFCTMGIKTKTTHIKSDDSSVIMQKLPLAITTDERICSGSAYSNSFKYMVNLLKNPEALESPPAKIAAELR